MNDNTKDYALIVDKIMRVVFILVILSGVFLVVKSCVEEHICEKLCDPAESLKHANVCYCKNEQGNFVKIKIEKE